MVSTPDSSKVQDSTDCSIADSSTRDYFESITKIYPGIFGGPEPPAATINPLSISVESQEHEASHPSSTSPKNNQKIHKTRKIRKIHSCHVCGDRFSSLRVMGDHMRDVHNLKGFRCGNCKYSAARHDNLEMHKRTCKPLPPKNNQVAAESSGRPTRPKGPRISIRNIKPPLLPTQIDGAYSVPNRIVETTASDRTLETEALKEQLSVTEIKLENALCEISHWKDQFFNLQKNTSVS
ncbi:hypothetical protein TWF730_010026 [Orbilia blumenaviensis]|uniref:C2H2-type domain-containing protein n=1 Tax=Orbilia blumenaviensis TaxID=1796055 RepID=A0AAV9UTH7_9PEZI